MSIDTAVPRPPRILVLLATWNGALWIDEQIRSVLAQTGVDVSICVRDDGSTDRTRDLLIQISRFDTRIRLHDDCSRLGSASANFFRLMMAADVDDCDYVALCDQDDVWLPEKLLRAVACLKLTGASGYSSAVCATWPDGKSRVLGQSSSISNADFLFEGAGQGCTFVIDRSHFKFLQQVFRENLDELKSIHYHDWAIYAVTRARGGVWAFDKNASMLYRQHGGNDTGAKLSLSGIYARLLRIKDGWYRAQVVSIAKLVVLSGVENDFAARWIKISDLNPERRLFNRILRLLYVCVYGRRSIADRFVQLGAVLAGKL